jgi:hypothetical protein
MPCIVGGQKAGLEPAADLDESRRDAGGHVPITDEEPGAVPWASVLGTLDRPGVSRHKYRVLKPGPVARLLW